MAKSEDKIAKNRELYMRFQAASGEEKLKLRAQLMAENEGLAKRFAGKYLGKERITDDVVQTAKAGLLAAIDRWDPAKGSLSTFAAYYIRWYLQENAKKEAAYTKPRSERMPAEYAEKARLFRLANGKEPTAEDLGVDEETFAKWNSSVYHESLYAPSVGAEDSDKGEEHFGNQDHEMFLNTFALSEALQKIYAKFSPLYQEVLRLRLEEGWTIDEVAIKVGLRSTRVRDLQTHMFNQVRDELGSFR